MSNNDLFCDKCKSHHHPVECPKDEEPMTPENQSDEEEVPSDEEILRHIICEGDGFCTPKELCGNCKGTLLQIKKLLTAQRQSWELEKKELEAKKICHCPCPDCLLTEKKKREAVEAERDHVFASLAAHEERVKIIEQDRDSWRRCAERLETEKTEPKLTINIEESAIKELFKNQAEELTRLKARNEELERRIVCGECGGTDLVCAKGWQEERSRLKAELHEATLRASEYKNEWESALYREQGLKSRNEELEAENAEKEKFLKGYDETVKEIRAFLGYDWENGTHWFDAFKKKIDRLTASLSAAHEAFNHVKKELEETALVGATQTEKLRIKEIWEFILEILKDPTGKLALERWKRMEAVVSAAMNVLAECEKKADANETYASVMLKVLDMRDALESLDAKGGVK